MKKIITLLSALLLCVTLQAAYLTNVPRTLIQPNGDTLHCFASGDEYYVRLHDAQGYTIVQNPQTGYFVYAVRENGHLKPSSWIAGQCNPAAKGLMPNLRISREEYLKLRREMVVPAKRAVLRDENTNHGTMNNLAVFIRFADDTLFTNNFDDVNLMFNDTSDNYYASSLFDYFKRTSYNQLFIRTTFYPAPIGQQILSYQDSFPRGYFMPWSETNPIGYLDTIPEDSRTTREHKLLKRACDYVADMIPADLDIDYDNDGYVDNVCFIVKGNVGDWNVLLWPHRWSLYTEEAYFRGKRVYDFNFQLADAGGYFNTSVMCHEMFHTLGAPDLYHYHDSTDMNPVGAWDLMCSNQNPPQQTCAYMKYKYGNWLTEDDLILLENFGSYIIKPLNSETSDRVSYYAKTQWPSYYIFTDFRNGRNPFDSQVPGYGMVFYRVNALGHGNANYNGDDNLDEIYVYRRDGSPTENGYINSANFRGNIHIRNEFSPLTNPWPFLPNGEFVPVYFNNFSSGRDSMLFDFVQWVSVTDYEQGQFTAYPNPAEQYITVESSLDRGFACQLYNIQGQLLETMDTQESKCILSVASLPAGTYFIKIYEDHKYYKTLKFIKQ